MLRNSGCKFSLLDTFSVFFKSIFRISTSSANIQLIIILKFDLINISFNVGSDAVDHFHQLIFQGTIVVFLLKIII